MTESKIAIDKYIDAISIHKELLIEFFVVFSRFEYALKRARYCKSNNAAMPDWDRFACECKELKSADVLRLKEVGSYLIEFPPRQQIFIDNCLSFAPITFVDGTHLVEKLIRYVKTVRNNLFHGGKYPGEYVEEPGRNPELLKSSIATLLCFLNTHEKLHELFVDVE